MLIAQLIINLKANVNKPQEPKLFKNLAKVLNWLQCKQVRPNPETFD